MKILFLTITPEIDLHVNGIYNDLLYELSRWGHSVYAICPIERRMKQPTNIEKVENITVLRVQTWNIMNVSTVEKGVSLLTTEKKFLKAVQSHFPDIKFDLILYTTPPITFTKLIKQLKNKHNAFTYLILKDIFPQNAVDLGLLQEGGTFLKYFRKVEQRLYDLSDKIGCMSQANMEYIEKHNRIPSGKLEIFPNAILPRELPNEPNFEEKVRLFKKYRLDLEKPLFIYGGNIGLPQGAEFIKEVMKSFHEEKIKNAHLLIIGRGTKFNEVKEFAQSYPNQISVEEMLPKKDFDILMNYADVGLIFLNPAFTIPNFPSRLTAYMESKVPIIAALDKATDVGEVIKEAEAGYSLPAGDLDAFVKYANYLAENTEARQLMGKNGRLYLETHFNIRKEVPKILDHLDGEEAEYV
jgi:glycosyltransferase involved in cell wall biosynthesis